MHQFDRRSFVAMLGSSLSGVAVSAQPLPLTQPRTALTGKRPNVILMICDDLGAGDLGCCGSKLNTPNLDRMAREGARFTRFNTAHPICSASRSALLTGRYATRTGTRGVYRAESKDGLPLEEVTLANLLHAQRYRSIAIGKWHLGSQPEYLPTNRGFDSFLGVPYSIDMHPLPLMENLRDLQENADRALLTPTYTDAAVKFIETPSVDPFFMYLGFSYPHVPVDASPRFKGKSRFGIYGDAVEEIDWSVGQILDALKRRGLDDNTLLMFTSDHGPWYQGMPGPHRGRKGTSFEGGCRVPFLARWSGHIPAGYVCDAGASNLDILPTVASICGAHPPGRPLDGIDISDLLTGGNVEPERADPLLYFSALHAGQDLQCARSGRWKLRIAQYTKVPYILGAEVGDNLLLARPELFDLDEDPGESYDLASMHPEIVRQIAAGISRSMAGFPPNILRTFEALLKSPGKPSTYSGAPPQPLSPNAAAAPEG